MPFWLFVTFLTCVLVFLVSIGLWLYFMRLLSDDDKRLVGLKIVCLLALLFSIVLGLTSLLLRDARPQPAIPVQERFLMSGPFNHPRYLYAETLLRADVVLWVARKLNTPDIESSFRGYIVYRRPSGALTIRLLRYTNHRNRNLYALAHECILQGNIDGSCRRLRTYKASGYEWDGPVSPVAGYAFRLYGCHPKPLPPPVMPCTK